METNVEIKIKNHKDFLSLENDKHGTVQISLEDRKVWGMYVPKKLNSIIEWEKKQNKTKQKRQKRHSLLIFVVVRKYSN